MPADRRFNAKAAAGALQARIYGEDEVDEARIAEALARAHAAGRAEALRDLGTLGFVLDLGLRETIGAMKHCPDHGSAKVEAVVWGKRRGWCANHNPFVIRALLTESEPSR